MGVRTTFKNVKRSSITSFLFTACLFYLALCLASYLVQRAFIYVPERTVPARAVYGATDMNIVTVETADGLNLRAWYKAPVAPEKPVIILFHGNASHYGGRTFKARIFLDEGYGYLLAGYRGYGGNKGRPSEQGLYKDARAYIDWLIKEQGVPPGKIVLAGESLGSGVAVQMALEYPDIAALILETPYTSMVDLGRRQFFFLPLSLLMKDRYKNIDKIGDLNMPLLIVHGSHDMIVPVKQAQALYEAAPEPKEIAIYDGGGHNNLYLYGAGTRILKFLETLPSQDL